MPSVCHRSVMTNLPRDTRPWHWRKPASGVRLYIYRCAVRSIGSSDDQYGSCITCRPRYDIVGCHKRFDALVYQRPHHVVDEDLRTSSGTTSSKRRRGMQAPESEHQRSRKAFARGRREGVYTKAHQNKPASTTLTRLLQSIYTAHYQAVWYSCLGVTHSRRSVKWQRNRQLPHDGKCE